MIGLDTNVLVRFLVTRAIRCSANRRTRFMRISSHLPGPAWIGIATIMELVWVMTRIYGTDQNGMVRILDSLLNRPLFAIEQPDVLHEALRLYRKGTTGFADCLTAASARAAGCSTTLTFDKRAARDAGMELIA